MSYKSDIDLCPYCGSAYRCHCEDNMNSGDANERPSLETPYSTLPLVNSSVTPTKRESVLPKIYLPDIKFFKEEFFR